MNTFTLVSIIFVIIILIWLAWRLASRRQSIPCPPWLSWLLVNPFEPGEKDTTLRSLGLTPGMQVLDFGCGAGRLAIPAARMVGALGSVTALDLQPEMLARARQKAEAAGLENIRFVQSSAAQAQLQTGFYDRAMLVTVLGEIPVAERAAALKAIHAALKPGGLLAVTETVGDPHYKSQATVLRLTGAAGFKEVGRFGSVLRYTLVLGK
jgi:ubiquinone/menaquinone biosynthesis C-methylase UbiE